MDRWHLYLIRTREGSLYTGIAIDVERRVEAHRAGKGSRYLRARGPLGLVYSTPVGDRSLALRAEYQMKRLPKRAKEAIVTRGPDCSALLATLGLGADR